MLPHRKPIAHLTGVNVAVKAENAMFVDYVLPVMCFVGISMFIQVPWMDLPELVELDLPFYMFCFTIDRGSNKSINRHGVVLTECQ